MESGFCKSSFLDIYSSLGESERLTQLTTLNQQLGDRLIDFTSSLGSFSFTIIPFSPIDSGVPPLLLTIQGNPKDSNSDFKWYKRLYDNNKFGKRREYVKIVRNILIDMNEPDEAASFQNQSINCVNKPNDIDFEACLKILAIDLAEKLGGNKKREFLQKLKSRNII